VRLVNLEIKGFKSFPEKTVINFNDNITGVVGPNGCGKSNIVDAIRWVLGEQKTSVLRSEKMENVIFNGTKGRKSSALAEVTLTLENNRNLLPTDYHTVTISRHYFRSGDSEYRLNNVSCRLKDITNLFLDTGISSDSYAIIELPMINDILNDKDGSRRKLFEQAAGISKYKARKKETMNKLEATELDINRVEDLLFEIQNNLKTLESQAKKTERYYKLKEEYMQLSIQLSLFSIVKIKQSFDTLEKQRDEEEQKKIAGDTDIITREAELQKEKTDNLEKEKALNQQQKALNEITTGIQKQENEKNLLAENLKYITDKKQSLLLQIEQAGAQVTTLQTEIQNLDVQKAIQAEEQAKHEKETTELKTELEQVRLRHTDHRNRLQEQQGHFTTSEKKIGETERTSTVLTMQSETLNNELAQLTTEYEQRRQQLENLKTDFAKLTEEEENQKAVIKQITDENDLLQTQIGEAQEKLDTSRQELIDINRKLDARQNEFQLTKSFVDSMEGFPESIKFLKQNDAQWSKDAPLLSDVISCPAEWRTAVESFLEPYLNYYVVKDTQEAWQALNLLGNSQKGRANFFVLSDFKNYQKKNNTVPYNSTAALDVVEVDGQYTNLANYLLDRVFITEQEEMPSTNSDTTILLNKAGKFIRYPYSVSGGQVGSFTGKRLGRVKNLETLRHDIEQLTAQSTEATEKINAAQVDLQLLRATSVDEQINEAREQYNLIRNRLIEVKTKIENLESANANYENRKQHILHRQQQLNGELEVVKQQLAGLQNEKSLHTSSLDAAKVQFGETDTLLAAHNEKFNAANIQFLQLKHLVDSTQQELQFKNLQLQNIHTQITTGNDSISQIANEIIDVESKLKVITEHLIASYQLKEEHEGVVHATEQIYFESKNKINSAEEAIRQLHRRKEQSELILNAIKEKINELKLELTGLRERLNIEFKTDIDTLMDQQPPADKNPEELTEQVQKMRGRIENYGEVNPMAMEAFNEMKTRADFIDKQKADLLNAKDSLIRTINEIELTAKEQFMTAFTQVKENFINVYHELFNPDDTCDLVLLEPDNLLETSIEIIAKPKGKRPSTINQLSGGEKALTAVSLLFALYLLKPAPFCILDEVDAPMDDSNIDRFNKMIRKFSTDSQFIVVTHNKQTMAAVDVIYGVTMAEEGVSKVVPVDFRSLNVESKAETASA
jgi:chromosome segregation protein